VKHEILIVSYWRDFPWLDFAIRSLDRFSAGFGITVVVPTGYEALPRQFLEKTKNLRWQVRSDAEPAGLGQLFSQVTKCSADVFVPKGTDVVTFFDSDCILTGHLTPDMLMKCGKPECWYETFESLNAHSGDSRIWQPVIEENLRFSVPVETMCRFPLSYPIGLFPRVRSHIEEVHRKRFADYVFNTGRNEFPQRFCESDVLGGYAWVKCPEIFHWTNVNTDHLDRLPLIQFWSHGGFDFVKNGEKQRDTIARILG